jgi:glycosyltransferase involved in cell wall biosynthesis
MSSMNLGLYYHIDAHIRDDGVWVPGFFAIFVEELARRAGSVTLYCHSDPSAKHVDRRLSSDIVRAVDLGPRSSAPARTLRPGRWLARFDPSADGIDRLLLRGPSPLLPHLVRAARGIPTAVLMVNDYNDWVPERLSVRNALIRAWAIVYGVLQRRALHDVTVMVNDERLARPFIDRGVPTTTVFTSSLQAADVIDEEALEARLADGVSTPARLLFVGRIVAYKGVFEAVSALATLVGRGRDVVLELVGAEDEGAPTIDAMMDHARSLGVGDRVVLGGYLSGATLTDAYRRADVFVLPSYWEGFPRVVVEAMANGVPVVATNVGGLGDGLSRDLAILVEPRDVDALADAAQFSLDDDDRREAMIRAAWRWASGRTNERSCELILATMPSSGSVPSR